ncbi:hypothetical protein IQ781_21705 [Bacillus sp. N447-1]|uniref:hypothetical protein n=1 Tax=Bacillus TaxID=1386 RepID=UPI0005DEA841|nr:MULTISPECIES: hypothetical protein [Bacillus]CGF77995.1 Uncharacterised protein [Streptococcus pneumoniae]TNP09591.1 hypothetical protein FHY65_00865 [Bacillus cereus]UNT68056.1 hypothetical protein IQ781_21705 [Bacillus sp. N447-1]CIZ87027.1 Uncharacterised protein [Streptococcus pneumoniae]CJA13395.1 Uncharacterised protein [Streptococcus pneumoniae]
MMMNRVIFEGETYYKVNDLKELYNVSMYKIKKAIKEQGIKTGKLEGFGRALFILEAELNMLEIDGAVTYMKTAVKDYRETLTTHVKAASWAYAFTGVKISNEELLQKVNDKAIDEINAFGEQGYTRSERDLEETETVEKFNDLAEKHGYSDRLHRIDLLIDGEILNIEFCTVNDEIATAQNYTNIIHGVSTDYLDEAFELGRIDDGSYDDTEYTFTKGVSQLTSEEAFVKLLKKVYEKHSKINDEEYMEDENGLRFASFTYEREADIVIALLRDNYKLVNRALQF